MRELYWVLAFIATTVYWGFKRYNLETEIDDLKCRNRILKDELRRMKGERDDGEGNG